MATSGNNPKSAAVSTPAAQPAASQAATEGDALPSRGAVRGDMLGIKDALSSELGQLSDGHTDDNDGNADTEQTARLETFDEQAAAQADAETADDPAATEAGADDAAGGEEGQADSDAAGADESPESTETPPAAEGAEAETQKPEGVQARINELTARAKGAEERLAAAEERLAAYQARDAGALAPEALDHVETPEDLATTQQRYNALLSWAIKNPDGGRLGDREYSAEEVRTLHAEAQTLINEAIPQRRDYLAKRDAIDREAVNFYPWLKDASKGAGAMVHQAIKENPHLRRMPNHRLAIADAIVGQALRHNGIQLTDTLLQRLAAEAKSRPTQSGKKPAATPGTRPAAAKPPAAPARAGVLPPRLAPRAAAAKAAGQRLRASGGTEDDLASSIAAKL